MTKAQLEILAILSEECGEVIQAIGKIMRHGYDSSSPYDNSVTNRCSLTREIGDLLFVIGLICDSGDINENDVKRFTEEKAINIKQWLHHQ